MANSSNVLENVQLGEEEKEHLYNHLFKCCDQNMGNIGKVSVELSVAWVQRSYCASVK